MIQALLQQGPSEVQTALITALERTSIYHDDLVATIISLVSEQYSPNSYFYNIISDYLMGAWVHAYITQDRHQVHSFIEQTVTELFKRQSEPEFWARLWACNKGAMKDLVTERIVEQLSEILSTPPNLEPDKIIEYLRYQVLPQLDTHWETRLLGLVIVAYTGREPGVPMLAQAKQLLKHWPLVGESKKLMTKVNIYPTFSKKGQNYFITNFQREWAASFLNQLVKQLANSEFLTQDNLESIALRLERNNECVIVKLRVTLTPGLAQEEYEMIANTFRELPLYKKWRSATMPLLSIPIALEFRPERRDLLFTLSLWESPIREPQQWKWNRFYSYIVEETWEEKDLGAQYYREVTDRIRSALPLAAESLVCYALTQLDGIFAQTYNSSLRAIQSRLHTIKNVLEDLPTTATADEHTLEAAAVEIQRLKKNLLEISPGWLLEFDLRQTLFNFLIERRAFYPDIIFELPEISDGPAVVIRGSKLNILMAVWDIIHNAVDAARRLDLDKPRRIRISLVQVDDGVQVLIANTGLISADDSTDSQKRYGIGSKTVHQVVCDMHKGKVSHGPLADEEPFQYEWRLFFP